MSVSKRLSAMLRIPFAIVMVMTLAIGPVLAEDVDLDTNVDTGNITQELGETPTNPDPSNNTDNPGEGEGESSPEGTENTEGETEGAGDTPAEGGDQQDDSATPEDENIEGETPIDEGDAVGAGTDEINEPDEDADSDEAKSDFEITAAGPGTNDGNRDAGLPHFNIIDNSVCGQVTVEFVQTFNQLSFFEYSQDGAGAGSTAHPVVSGDVIYTGVNVDGRGTTLPVSVQRTFYGSEIRIRLALGGERDHDFVNWESITTQPCIGTANVTINKNYPEVDTQLPPDTSWTVTNRDTDEVVAQGTTGGAFPINFSIADLPYGDYTFAVTDMGPNFKTHTSGGASLHSRNFTVAGPTVDVVLNLQLTAMGAFYPLRSTNEANIENERPNVVQQDSVCGEITLVFSDPYLSYAYFEVLIDGEPLDGVASGTHEVVPNSPVYGGILLDSRTQDAEPVVRTFTAAEVQVRFALGQPGPGFFDWVTFESDPCVSDVTVNVVSSDPAIANKLPADAKWIVSIGDTVVDGDTFAAEHLQLPAAIMVNNPVPYGTYDVVVIAGPAFAPYSGQLVVNAETHVFEIELDPVEASAVTVNVVSADPALANTLPADASWTISFSGVEIASDTFTAEHLALPASIVVNDPVPFGEYVISIDAGPAFEPLTGHKLVVNQQTQAFTIELQPAAPVAETHTGTVLVVEAGTTTPVVGADVSIFGDDDDVAIQLTVFGLQSAGGGTGWGTALATGVTDETGAVVFTELSNGEYNVAVVATDGRTGTGVLTIAGEDSSVQIELQPLPTDPATPDPAEDKTVTKLPETGQGSGGTDAVYFIASMLGLGFMALTGLRLRLQVRS